VLLASRGTPLDSEPAPSDEAEPATDR
jgi:hypothetical protein